MARTSRRRGPVALRWAAEEGDRDQAVGQSVFGFKGVVRRWVDIEAFMQPGAYRVQGNSPSTMERHREAGRDCNLVCIRPLHNAW